MNRLRAIGKGLLVLLGYREYHSAVVEDSDTLGYRSCAPDVHPAEFDTALVHPDEFAEALDSDEFDRWREGFER